MFGYISLLVPWRSIFAIVGWVGGSVAMYLTLPWRLALPLAVGFGLVVMTLNKLKFPWPEAASLNECNRDVTPVTRNLFED
jgi:hypothetical protein